MRWLASTRKLDFLKSLHRPKKHRQNLQQQEEALEEQEEEQEMQKPQKQRFYSDLLRMTMTGGVGGSGALASAVTRARPTAGLNGGSGGKGGDIIIVANSEDPNLGYIREEEIVGNTGDIGRGGSVNGKNAKDTRISVPVGTTVYEIDKKEKRHKLATLTRWGQTVVAAKGGQGGLGSGMKNYAPSKQTGKPGESKRIELDLQIQHDVSILGFPQSGKSTLLSSLSNVQAPRDDTIENTVFPTMGYMRFINEKKVSLLDYPPFKHSSRSFEILPFPFKKHILSCKILLFVLDGSGEFFFDELPSLLNFVKTNSLLDRKLYFVVNKIDSMEPDRAASIGRNMMSLGVNHALVSLLTGQGVNKLVVDIQALLAPAR